MKRAHLILMLLLSLSLACSGSDFNNGGNEAITQGEAPPQSEKRCGDGICDGPENTDNCFQDCGGETDIVHEESETMAGTGDSELLFQITESTITANAAGETTCYSFNFRRYLDGGYVSRDGSVSTILELQDNPTSMVSSRYHGNYYYISSPIDPILTIAGYEVFNWDVTGQTLWAADFAHNKAVELVKPDEGQFPGGAATAPGNRYLVYPLTRTKDTGQNEAGGFLSNNINPYASDSSLIAVNLKNNGETNALADSYNRQLFTSFGDFSPDGSSFYTIAEDEEGFEFVQMALESGKITSFAEIFPGYDWRSVNWDVFFPRENDFAYAKFTLSPDEKRLVAYKNVFTASTQNPCVSEGWHHLWFFNLENSTLTTFKNQPGYVSDSTWKADSSQIGLALLDSGGCYPDYMDARIDLLDRDGNNKLTLVEEVNSKITNIGWSPDGSVIAYDVYTTDYIGRLKLVDVNTRLVNEVISTQDLGFVVSQTDPITLLFANWVSTQ